MFPRALWEGRSFGNCSTLCYARSQASTDRTGRRARGAYDTNDHKSPPPRAERVDEMEKRVFRAVSVALTSRSHPDSPIVTHRVGACFQCGETLVMQVTGATPVSDPNTNHGLVQTNTPGQGDRVLVQATPSTNARALRYAPAGTRRGCNFLTDCKPPRDMPEKLHR